MPQVGAVCDGSQDAFVVRIGTDTGLEGTGEGDSMPGVLEAIVNAPISNSIGIGLRDLLGQDPLQIEPLVQRMLDHTICLGGAGARLTAISAAEIALWDLTTTLERAHALTEFDLYWLEAPMPYEPMTAWAELAARSSIRISSESFGGFWESERFLREGRLRVIPPDVTNVGGIGAWKRIAQTAETHGAWCVPHAFSTGIVSAASRRLLANAPREHMIESSMEGSPLNTELTTPRLHMVDGYVDVPTAPGLGVALDPDVVERYRVR
ncbi:MAG: enolase C-terminal domain-like protein [Thermomicrobiales bacterium]